MSETIEIPDMDVIVKTLLASMLGWNKSLIRPMWQIDPLFLDDPKSAWCAYGVINIAREPGTEWWSGIVNETMKIIRYDEVTVQITFFGPDCLWDSTNVRDKLYSPFNNRYLHEKKVGLTSVEDSIMTSSLINNYWQQRCDMRVIFSREVSQTIDKPSLLGADVVLKSALPDQPIEVRK